MKTNILFFYPSPYLAPSWTVAAQIGRNLDPERFGKFAAVDEASGDLGFRPEHQVEERRFSLGSSVAQARQGNVRATARLGSELAWLTRYTRAKNIDVIHASDDGVTMMLALGLAQASCAKLIIHHHTIPSMYRGARLQFTRAMASLAALNVGVSRFAADDVYDIGISSAKIAFVHNGINPQSFHPDIDGTLLRQKHGVRPDDVLVLQLARIWQPKRQKDLVRALAIARRRAPRLRALIVGWEDPRYDGSFASYSEELRSIAREEQLGDALQIVPALPEAAQLHAAADIMVLPSINEPFGLVVIEAMATQRPVIAARSGGIREIIEDGKTGYLVEPRSPEQLADKLVLLAEAPELRRSIGAAARQRVLDYFTESRVASDFDPIYEALSRGQPIPASARL